MNSESSKATSVILTQGNPLPSTLMDRQKVASSDVVDLRPLFKVIWRKKGIILSVVLIVMFITAQFVKTIEPTYRASATLQIDQQQPQVVSIEQVYGLDGSSEYIQTQFELLKSRVLVEKVVKALNLTTHKEFDPRQRPPSLIDIKGWIGKLELKEVLSEVLPETMLESFETREPAAVTDVMAGVVDAFRKTITISPIKKSQLVVIHVQMHDAAMAAKAANMVGELFMSTQLDVSMEATQSALNWMKSRLEELKLTLKYSEAKLQAFKDKEGLIDVDGIMTISVRELFSVTERLVDARGKLVEASSQYNQVKKISKANWKKLASLPVVLSSRLIQSFKIEEARARAKVNELAGRYGERHPEMQKATSDLKAAQASLKFQVLQIVAGIKLQYQMASANVWFLKKLVAAQKEQIKDVSKYVFKISELQREVDSNLALFDTFMTRLKETTATSGINAVNARIADPAIQPRNPVKPRKGLIVVMSGFLAGLMTVVLILLFNALNNVFKRPEDIEADLSIPVMGIIPWIKLNRKEAIIGQTLRSDLYLSGDNRLFTESIKTIRTNIMLSNIDHPDKLIVVTSSILGEGKTITSTNLAISFGEMEKVLLIEANMRQPTMAKSFQLPADTPGLANLIANTADLEEAIQSLNGIDLLVAGYVPPNPLELLMSERFKILLTELKSQYDRIIIDSPFIYAVSDTKVLSTYADAVVYVVKYNATSRDKVLKGISQLLQSNAKVKGVVLNQVDFKDAKKIGYSFDRYYNYYGHSTND